jgi:N-ethylmaleimide reductase
MDELSSAEDALTVVMAVLERIDVDDLAMPTPCTLYDVGALADHLVNTITRSAAAAGGDASTPQGATVGQRVGQATRAALSAWRRRGLCGEVVFGGRTLPARMALGVLSLELLVHGWDFAVATRQPLAVSDTHADFVLALARQTLTPQSRIAVGLDDPVPIASDSPALDRLLAFTGRDPKSVEHPLLTPYRLGDLDLRNRMVMAPLTRARATNGGNIPTPLMAEYYRQRAAAGLIISEGIFVSERGRGWPGAPGLFTDEQVEGWKAVTATVHDAGGVIFAQLWHMGSVSLPEYHQGALPKSASAVNPGQLVHTDNGMVMSGVPEAMSLEDIEQVIEDFRNAAANAKQAGFDGVQIQGGFVYLFQQFLLDTTNLRTDQYGGSVENRARLLFDVVEAVLTVWPSQRVGVKAGPFMDEHGAFKATPSTEETAAYVYEKLNSYDLSHLLVMRQMADLSGTPIAHLEGDAIIDFAREHYDGTIILNVGLDKTDGDRLIRQGAVDLISYGRDFIANPDLVDRIRTGAPLNAFRPEYSYSGGAAGYTDYPQLPGAGRTE